MPDYYIFKAPTCACGDDPVRIPEARRHEGLEQRAHWCTGTLRMTDGFGNPKYIFNPLTYDRRTRCVLPWMAARPTPPRLRANRVLSTSTWNASVCAASSTVPWTMKAAAHSTTRSAAATFVPRYPCLTSSWNLIRGLASQIKVHSDSDSDNAGSSPTYLSLR
jgi:hypothetical protein